MAASRSARSEAFGAVISATRFIASRAESAASRAPTRVRCNSGWAPSTALRVVSESCVNAASVAAELLCTWRIASPATLSAVRASVPVRASSLDAAASTPVAPSSAV